MITATFKTGDTLATSSICNSECIYTATITKRTKCFVTIDLGNNEVKRCKVWLDDEGSECIHPHGTYSMAAIFRARRDVV